ncbi:predicted protein [Chaetomium globosum CBS 148.51]|uniref:Uncharacterized protein n=1 Tax=Chaetomium globosum (strain ATCC 6205 / CBS 148.51 / DSM 1962 / NBRC 6347 / NRRL 1970) TaxID=306901 RepID=Q2H4W0_CHAGB|nr:uncharacterized protein CHGG_06305 [Chaetomium globosum CBS 148.51]EAQ89686.1 predicted protein [Chaetomium globosum CBS 148.51]
MASDCFGQPQKEARRVGVTLASFWSLLRDMSRRAQERLSEWDID